VLINIIIDKILSIEQKAFCTRNFLNADFIK